MYFKIDVGVSTIDRCLKNFHNTVKSLVCVPERRNTESTIQQRITYSNIYRNLEAEVEDKNIIFLDEVGISVVTRTKKGRARIGETPFVEVPQARSRNISIVSAINKHGVIYNKVHVSAVNGEDFDIVIEELKEKCSAMNITNPVFIMDNARIHHYSGLLPVIERIGLNIVYLPPYSPFLNPI